MEYDLAWMQRLLIIKGGAKSTSCTTIRMESASQSKGLIRQRSGVSMEMIRTLANTTLAAYPVQRTFSWIHFSCIHAAGLGNENRKRTLLLRNWPYFCFLSLILSFPHFSSPSLLLAACRVKNRFTDFTFPMLQLEKHWTIRIREIP